MKKVKTTPKEKALAKKSPKTKKGTTKTTKSTTIKRKRKKEKTSIGKIFVGIILITIGLLYLAKTTGLIPVEFSFEVYELWPLLIIFAGLLLAKKRWISIFIGIVTTILVLGIIGIMIFGGRYFTDKTSTTTPIEIQKANNIKSAIVSINSGAGDLTITGDSKKLVEGFLKTNYMTLTTGENIENKIQNTYIGLTENWKSLFDRKTNEMDLQLNSKIPIEFHLNNGPSNTTLDFSDIKAEFIDINTKASTLDLTVGDNIEESKLKINADTSSIVIKLPKDMGANLVMDPGIMSSKTLTGFMEVSENKYQSENYTDVDDFIDIYVELNMSNLNIEWI